MQRYQRLEHITRVALRMAYKVESTPLLGPGFHVMTLEQVRALAVEPFETSSSRPVLFAKLQGLVRQLVDLRIPCDIWIDGSFITEKLLPSDLDLAIKVMDDVMGGLSEDQEVFLSTVSRDDAPFMQGLDAFVFSGYWIGHESYGTDIDDGYSKTVPTWGLQFGKGMDNWLKGIVVVPVLENDVGFRLRA